LSHECPDGDLLEYGYCDFDLDEDRWVCGLYFYSD